MELTRKNTFTGWPSLELKDLELIYLKKYENGWKRKISYCFFLAYLRRSLEINQYRSFDNFSPLQICIIELKIRRFIFRPLLWTLPFLMGAIVNCDIFAFIFFLWFRWFMESYGSALQLRRNIKKKYVECALEITSILLCWFNNFIIIFSWWRSTNKNTYIYDMATVHRLLEFFLNNVCYLWPFYDGRVLYQSFFHIIPVSISKVSDTMFLMFYFYYFCIKFAYQYLGISCMTGFRDLDIFDLYCVSLEKSYEGLQKRWSNFHHD